jgi:hypothetical protein
MSRALKGSSATTSALNTRLSMYSRSFASRSRIVAVFGVVVLEAGEDPLQLLQGHSFCSFRGACADQPLFDAKAA